MVSTRESSPSPPPTPIYTHATRKDMNRERRVSLRLSTSDHRVSKNSEFARMLLHEEREAKDLRNMLMTVTEQLKEESRRADENERRARDAIVHFKAINDARIQAQQDATRANEELKLYKIQLENAQREIFKAQEILNSMEDLRYEAEASAARARSTARKIKEERLVDLAREEGRRLGMQEGITRGRRIGFEHGRSVVEERASRTPSERYFAEDRDDVRSFTSQPDLPPAPLDPIDLNFPDSPTVAIPPPIGDIDLRRKTTSVRNPPSPLHHPENIIPQEGFIPHADADSTIRLPPPHEMQRTVSSVVDVGLMDTPRSVPRSIDSAPLMVPNPGSRRHYQQDTPREEFHPRRPASPSSPGSTTISQFELVSEPYGPSSRPSRQNRRSLSVIPESISGTTTPAADGTRSLAGDVVSRPVSAVPTGRGSPNPSVRIVGPAPQSPATVASGLDDTYVYNRPSYASFSTDSTSKSKPDSPVRTPRSVRSLSNRISTSSSVPEITVVPPSRSTTQTPQATPATMRRELLSAEDAANRPIPPPTSPRNTPQSLPTAPVAPIQFSPNHSSPIILPDGQLPPGFVPLGPPMTMASPGRAAPIYSPSGATAPTSRAPSATGVHPGGGSPHPSRGFGPPSGRGAETIPTPPAAHVTSVPKPTQSSTSSRRSKPGGSTARSAGTGSSPVVLPSASLFSRANESSSTSTETDDEAVASSLASSNDTLSTPPPTRHRKRAPARQSYDTAPIQGGVEYPSSPLARVATPGSSSVATPYGRTLNVNAGMTPGARHANLGGARR